VRSIGKATTHLCGCRNGRNGRSLADDDGLELQPLDAGTADITVLCVRTTQQCAKGKKGHPTHAHT
jgi:hypothetical protein